MVVKMNFADFSMFITFLFLACLTERCISQRNQRKKPKNPYMSGLVVESAIIRNPETGQKDNSTADTELIMENCNPCIPMKECEDRKGYPAYRCAGGRRVCCYIEVISRFKV